MKHLPDEIILYIISYLEPSALVNLQHVSRHFLNLSRDNNLWKTLCFEHSAAERRRRRLAPTVDIDPRLAELIRAADNISSTFNIGINDANHPSGEVQRERNEGKRRAALLANWDPSYPEEKVNWYQDFIQRHAPQQVSWFQDAGHDEEEGDRRAATGAGVLFNEDGLADKLVAPLEDGSISIWDACASSERQGRLVAKSDIGLLPNKSSDDLDHDTRLTQSQAIMTETGAVECVSIDSKLKKGFFAVQNVLNEVDLQTLKVVSRTPYPFPITALSEAHHHTPLTVGTNWTIHLHDTRKPPAPSSTRCELIGGSADTSFSRLQTGDFGGHVSLSQPGALSIIHLPTTREWDGNGDIWVGGRFTSMLNFDRRFFPRLRGTVHSGARLSCMATLPHPFVPHDLRLDRPYSSARDLSEAKDAQGHTLIVAGEYKGKGSLELYGLSSEPTRSVNSSDSRTTHNNRGCYQNRQTASSSKLLAVAPHGTRIVFSDGDGNLKWVERDGSTPVRHFNINDLSPSPPPDTSHPILLNPQGSAAEDGDIVQKILPAVRTTHSSVTPELGQDNLILWTGDGKLGLLGFGREPPLHADVFEDALERQLDGDGGKEKEMQKEYSVEMRRALEGHARELRWLKGYGL
ncbi:hypothetical protein P153DRAFT_386869 [Dothidotthia symphoricarpi CBS 119687]|uniref:F-box domain-containing protein n=1 Tax=Dothidotthia symphoricarpi CBS 119687 TaxID=1392245 RepID=A0A6A6A793_9PLEO|nr:uncharacterized protein P153DRAFT_386869 [Dothidotthia symphoricarpi CBS 119687]KAF2127892.1 hypothetical protein P153DRAFT_386869 [Dothidotthia symphoricarpi CBS 119687]